jgi:hypothetical protein
MFAVRRINDSLRLAFPHDLHFEDLHLEDPEDRRTAIPFSARVLSFVSRPILTN